jgi:hypothetical protein
MTDLRTAAQQVLKSLRGYRREINCEQPCDAERALEAALEQPVQEPVAWNSVGATSLEFETECSDGTRFLNVAQMPAHAVRWRVVTPPRREWRGLTDEQLLYVYNELPNWGMDMDRLPPKLKQFARAVEAALKEKNHE